MHAVNFIETEYIMYFIFQIKTSFGLPLGIYSNIKEMYRWS